MAKNTAVWGIDIGQCALKALRCRATDDKTRISAEAFDYIEYPKILSQPEADPVALVKDAIKLFLSRNSVRGDKVVISVSGQSGLARFIKLPPVESRKIPDIVKYEARQQIPFQLQDVVWDYQQMVGGSVEEGFALETEVGLFAMKRDQVYRVLKPFTDAGIDVDFVQLTPLALCNFVIFDQMPDLPPPEAYDPESPPEFTVVLSLGTDTTDVVVTNGFRVWQRSLPIGGSHFTKALTKEMKLTFATAEHMKRNASQAEDAKALFQAMRPVFGDLLTEVQRSISYYSNLDRRAKIGRVVALGNAMKLPALQRYLSQNLGNEVTRIESFRGLTGAAVVDAPVFKENTLAFGVCYGLVLQGLGMSKLRTNLLPREIMQDRLVNSKKPWAVAAAALVLLALSLNFFQHYRSYAAVRTDEKGFGGAISQADSAVNTANQFKSAYEQAKNSFNGVNNVGLGLLANVEARELWLEAIKAINLCIPTDTTERPKDIRDIPKRREMKITSIDCRRSPELSNWYATLVPYHEKPADPNAPAPPPPSGPGWVFEIRGSHYYNEDPNEIGPVFVKNTLMKNLQLPEVPLPLAERVPGGPTTYKVGKIGISHPVLCAPGVPVIEAHAIEQSMTPVGGSVSGQPEYVELKRFDFVVQFCWKEILPSQRLPDEPAPEGAPADPAAEPGAGQTAFIQ